MTFLAFLVFIPLQIVWLPLSLLGALLVGYRQLVTSKRLEVSQTAVEILNGRWAMDVFGLRSDKEARRLAAELPNNSVFGLWLTLFPLWAAHKATGIAFLYPTLPAPAKAGIANLVPLRTVMFDELIERRIADAAQFVILGAGLDTRAYGKLKISDVAFYELDQTKEQTHKRKHLAAAKIDASHVRFVEVDFSEADWINSLLATDFDPAKRTIFLWEGVTLYLSEQSVKATLEALKKVAAPGSVILADIYASRLVKLSRNKAISWSLEMTGEEMAFGLDCQDDADGQLQKFVETQGLALGAYEFLGGAHKKGPFVAVVELVI
ncbi:MAG: SAM-dependent methyltransferase [Pseudomonadota bacterium]